MSAPTDTAAEPRVRITWRPPWPLHVRQTLSILRRGGYDPCHRSTPDGAVWRTARFPSGPVTYRITQFAPLTVQACAWGDGAAEWAETLPDLLGGRDEPDTFDPRLPHVAEAHRRHPGFRVPATVGQELEMLIGGVFEQKVIGIDAFAAWTRLVGRFGDPAPGPAPAGMRVAPTAAVWRSIPSWEWHRAGVDPQRARTAVLCAREGDALARVAGDREALYRRMRAIPGVGVWTIAQVGHRALGDADALPLGDYHLARITGHALAGTAIADADVEAFYEPWRPHRFRVLRLMELSGGMPPRRGPRMTRVDHRRI